MNILVISGGSGNDALIKGLKSFYPESNVKVLVNAYDAGKSTGVCRQVTNTLGVSDIRKNHIRMYKATTDDVNQSLVEFYDARYDFTSGNEAAEVISKLESWGLEDLAKYAESFFARETSKDFSYKDFNVSNIIYAEMYSQIGYEQTHKYFCDLLGLDDFVILNSFDNIFIGAETETGKVITEEGDLVEYCNPDDIIVKMIYDLHGECNGLNPKAIDALNDADLIIVSTGTFWSSIFPTLEYSEFYKYLNVAPGKKIWAMNCEPDKDCYGVGSNRLIKFVSDLGVDLSQFIILENSDANEILREMNEDYNIVYESMDNNKGKHNGDKYARAVLKHYYGLKDIEDYSQIIFDFDDTLWARKTEDAATNKKLTAYSRENIQLVNELENKATIISGNSYSSINKKLATVYGSEIADFHVDVWADANSALFRNGERKAVIRELVITGDVGSLVNYMKTRYDLNVVSNDEKYPSCLKIKPLSKLDQVLVANYLNDYILGAASLGYCKAVPTGTSTVDIVSKVNNKAVVLNHIDADIKTALYIGDETDIGNDKEISELCGSSIHTTGILETNALLRLLLNK